jgi:hypothetical protein
MQDITLECQRLEETPRLFEVRSSYVIGKKRWGVGSTYAASLPRRTSDSHIVRLSTRSLGSWLFLSLDELEDHPAERRDLVGHALFGLSLSLQLARRRETLAVFASCGLVLAAPAAFDF